jgi:hypothetical protein
MRWKGQIGPLWGTSDMRKIGMALITAAVLLGVTAQHDAIAGDLLGIGANVSIGSHAPAPPPPPSPYGPPVVYAGAPDYVLLPPNCYWTRGEPVWDGYRWIEPRVQVCD